MNPNYDDLQDSIDDVNRYEEKTKLFPYCYECQDANCRKVSENLYLCASCMKDYKQWIDTILTEETQGDEL
jgi:hypothetical protein